MELNIRHFRLSVCPGVTLFHSQKIFVEWLLEVQLFVDILYTSCITRPLDGGRGGEGGGRGGERGGRGRRVREVGG